MISEDQHLSVFFALFAIALFGFWAEKQRWGRLLTGTVWTILVAILAANVGLIPQQAAAYSIVFQYFVPLLIPLFLLHADIRKILVESGRVGLAFAIACGATMVGALAGATMFNLGDRSADLAGIFTATYTGGSVNYAALIQATGFDDANVISAATAVDNLMSAVFLGVLAVLPAFGWIEKRFSHRRHDEGEPTASLAPKSENTTAFSLAYTLVFALGVVVLSDLLIAWINASFSFDASRLRYVVITLLSILPATFFPRTTRHFSGGESLGVVLAFVFFAAIAAGADVRSLLTHAPILLAFVIVLLAIHLVLLLTVSAILRAVRPKGLTDLSLPELIIASNAAILGATTAPALAMARGWTNLATPGILAGVAGYIVGTPLGLLVASIAA